MVNYFWQRKPPTSENEVLLTEIILADELRAQHKEMTEAKRKEATDVLRRGAFAAVLTEEIPVNANVIPGRFVLAIKSNLDGRIKYKTRFFVGGHCDRLEDFMHHSRQALQPQSIRMILAIEIKFEFDI